jgi:hypothetical protein
MARKPHDRKDQMKSQHEATLWALAKANEIVAYEGSADEQPSAEVPLSEVESDRTLLIVAVSQALMEAYSLGVADGLGHQTSAGQDREPTK